MRKLFLLLIVLTGFFALFPQADAVAPPPQHCSNLVSENVPTQMTPGQQMIVTIKVINTSHDWGIPSCIAEATWLRNLVSLRDYGSGIWTGGTTKYYVTSDVAVGSQYIFSFPITAPSTSGVYSFNWGTYQQRFLPYDYFGWGGVFKNITVSSPTPTPPPGGGTPTPTPAPFSVDLEVRKGTGGGWAQQYASDTKPLNNISLRGTTSNGVGRYDYYFWCNRSDTGTNVTNDYDTSIINTVNNIGRKDNLCDYSSSGTYWTKIIARDRSNNTYVQDQAKITVAVPPPIITITMSANPKTGVERVDSTLTATATTTDPLQTFNYSMWYNCANTTTSVQTANLACGTLTAPPVGTCVETTNIGYKCDGVSGSTLQEIILHTYSSPATYMPKVILEQGTATNVQSQDTVVVSTDPRLGNKQEFCFLLC